MHTEQIRLQILSTFSISLFEEKERTNCGYTLTLAHIQTKKQTSYRNCGYTLTLAHIQTKKQTSYRNCGYTLTLAHIRLMRFRQRL